jgi:hypothetical protein
MLINLLSLENQLEKRCLQSLRLAWLACVNQDHQLVSQNLISDAVMLPVLANQRL